MFSGILFYNGCFTLVLSQALPDGILNNLVTMINYMKEGEFVRANDVYLLTAIGNAPWPIGLTMVGIHERSGAYMRVPTPHNFTPQTRPLVLLK